MIRHSYKKVFTLIFIPFCLLGNIQFSAAQDKNTQDKYVKHNLSNKMTLVKPLADFIQRDQQIKLRNTNSEIIFFVPISERYEVLDAVLHLEYINSISLLKGRSQLNVSLNEHIIGQLSLKPDQPQGVANVRLPKQFLEFGYNRLAIEVAQHYTLECEDPTAPELWTQIDTKNSNIAIQVVPRALEGPYLSELSTMIDSKLWDKYSLNIITATDQLQDVHLQWGALIAQGVALKLDYLPLQVHHKSALNLTKGTLEKTTQNTALKFDISSIGNMDAVLVGTVAELLPFIDSTLLDKIQGSFIAILPQYENANNYILVISGTNEDEVTQATLAFAHLDFPLPDTDIAIFDKVTLPDLARNTGKNAVAQGNTYLFSQFGFETQSLRGNKLSNILKSSLSFWVPPDLFAAENSNVVLRLHMAYGAGLRSDSVLNITLNDKFVNAIALEDEEGGVFRDYNVDIPLRLFQPGNNNVVFEPHMIPKITTQCGFTSSENLRITFFDDSKISIPKAEHYVQMPDISLFVKTGFPYNIEPDGSSMVMQIANNDSSSIESGWTILAKVAQKSGAPLYKAEITFSQAEQNKDVILVGKYRDFNENIIQAAPIILGSTSNLPHSTGLGLTSVTPSTSWWQQIQKAVFPVVNLSETISKTAYAQVVHRTGLGSYGAVLQFESPIKAGKTITMFTAEDGNQLSKRMLDLTKPSMWNALKGDINIWKETPKSFRSQSFNNHFLVGKVSLTTQTEYMYSRHPIIAILVTLLLMIILAVVTRKLLIRFRQRHHPNASGLV